MSGMKTPLAGRNAASIHKKSRDAVPLRRTVEIS
jgi:hypothetical protein